jgi:hypothetical protein
LTSFFYSTGASDNLRSLADIDLTAFKAAKDPTCNQVVDCSKESNFVDGKEFRTIDGSCNNKEHFSWGFAGAQHIRLPENNAYQDGMYFLLFVGLFVCLFTQFEAYLCHVLEGWST